MTLCCKFLKDNQSIFFLFWFLFPDVFDIFGLEDQLPDEFVSSGNSWGDKPPAQGPGPGGPINGDDPGVPNIVPAIQAPPIASGSSSSGGGLSPSSVASPVSQIGGMGSPHQAGIGLKPGTHTPPANVLQVVKQVSLLCFNWPNILSIVLLIII